MADVEQRAEAEAAHKGLSGGAARAYVGGVFNRIRQAHSRGTQPGKGARHLQRKARVEARQEARNRVSRHEQLAALEKQRLRSRTHREEPRKGSAEGVRDKNRLPLALTLDLHPIRRVEGGEINPLAPVDVSLLREVYGDAQLEKALTLYDTGKLRDAARDAGMPSSGNRRQLIQRLAQPAAPKKLVPIKQFDGNFQLDATRTMDPEFIREYFGEGQMRTAFELQTEHNLEQTIRLLEKRTGKEYRGPKTKAAMVNWILANG